MYWMTPVTCSYFNSFVCTTFLLQIHSNKVLKTTVHPVLLTQTKVSTNSFLSIQLIYEQHYFRLDFEKPASILHTPTDLNACQQYFHTRSLSRYSRKCLKTREFTVLSCHKSFESRTGEMPCIWHADNYRFALLGFIAVVCFRSILLSAK